MASWQYVRWNLPFHYPLRCSTDSLRIFHKKEWLDFLTSVRMKAWRMVGLETGPTRSTQVAGRTQAGDTGLQQNLGQAQAEEVLVTSWGWGQGLQGQSCSLKRSEQEFRQESTDWNWEPARSWPQQTQEQLGTGAGYFLVLFFLFVVYFSKQTISGHIYFMNLETLFTLVKWTKRMTVLSKSFGLNSSWLETLYPLSVLESLERAGTWQNN